MTERAVVGPMSFSDRAWWFAFVVAIAGPLLFGMGYANMGVRIGGFPVPIADVLLVLLLARALAPVVAGRAPIPELPILCAFALAAIAVVRLPFDHGTYGVVAARDLVLPLELTSVAVGAWAMRRYGLGRWKTALTWIFLAAQAYFLLGLVVDLSAVGPIGGFVQPRPLLHPAWAVDTAATAGFFFFLWVRPLGRWSLVIAVVAAVLAVLGQKRGIYIALPLAAIVTVVLGWRGFDRSTRRYLLAAGAVLAIGVSLVFLLAPSGRFGKLTPSLVLDQLGTLIGVEGTGSGTLSHRAEWTRGVIDQMNARPSSYLVGLGLGPDLLQGFVDPAGLPVRKPHNDYLEVMARLGIPALVLMLIALVVPLGAMMVAARRLRGSERDYLLFAIGASLVISFIAATQPILSYPFGTIPLGFYLGSGYAIARDRARQASLDRTDGVDGARVAD